MTGRYWESKNGHAVFHLAFYALFIDDRSIREVQAIRLCKTSSEQFHLECCFREIDNVINIVWRWEISCTASGSFSSGNPGSLLMLSSRVTYLSCERKHITASAEPENDKIYTMWRMNANVFAPRKHTHIRKINLNQLEACKTVEPRRCSIGSLNM